MEQGVLDAKIGNAIVEAATEVGEQLLPSCLRQLLPQYALQSRQRHGHTAQACAADTGGGSRRKPQPARWCCTGGPGLLGPVSGGNSDPPPPASTRTGCCAPALQPRGS